MGLLKNIEWNDQDASTIVYRYDMKRDYVSKGSALTVRDSQVCIFAHKGKMADVFEPGFYKLDTDSIPIITTLLSWKYGFENVFRSDIYYVSTRQFTNNKWGTANPIMIRDREFGPVRFQPAEISKIATSLMLATYMSQLGYKITKIKDFIITALIIIVPMGIIVLQSETGSALVYVGFIFMLYREGLSGWLMKFFMKH